MIKNKIKQLLLASDITQVEVAKRYGVTKQTFANKVSRETFKIQDLIKLADVTKTKLCFIDENEHIVVRFDMEDIKKRDSH